jgi:hypothetical protein
MQTNTSIQTFKVLVFLFFARKVLVFYVLIWRC